MDIEVGKTNQKNRFNSKNLTTHQSKEMIHIKSRFFFMKVPPESPGTPEVVEVNASGQISLVWDPPRLLCSN